MSTRPPVVLPALYITLLIPSAPSSIILPEHSIDKQILSNLYGHAFIIITRAAMRRGLIIFLIVNLCVLGFLVNCVFTLITLLFEDCSADAIHSYDIPAPNSDLIDARPQVIPKIIHQTWRNESIPERWQEPQQSCIKLHSDYEYKVAKALKERILYTS